jgi:hypothetical protein
MGWFSKKSSDEDSGSQDSGGQPYEVDNVLDLSRDPAIVRVTWSDGAATYHKPGTDYER